MLGLVFGLFIVLLFLGLPMAIAMIIAMASSVLWVHLFG